jgi:hypothetical protein
MPPLQATPSSQAVSSGQGSSNQGLSNQGLSNQDASTISGKPENPMCPTCQRAMTVKLVMPSMSAISVDETVYVCDVCGTETHRAAKRR